LVAWLIRLAASPAKLRRFGPPGKSGPGETAIAESPCQKPFPNLGRKLDKQIDQPVAPPEAEAGRSLEMSAPVGDDRQDGSSL
jgi:hypothetical protein